MIMRRNHALDTCPTLTGFMLLPATLANGPQPRRLARVALRFPKPCCVKAPLPSLAGLNKPSPPCLPNTGRCCGGKTAAPPAGHATEAQLRR